MSLHGAALRLLLLPVAIAAEAVHQLDQGREVARLRRALAEAEAWRERARGERDDFEDELLRARAEVAESSRRAVVLTSLRAEAWHQGEDARDELRAARNLLGSEAAGRPLAESVARLLGLLEASREDVAALADSRDACRAQAQRLVVECERLSGELRAARVRG